MPDYNLAGLSPRSFEQLIQSLAARLIGPHIVVFGDGRDGGREATFDGPIPFPSREHGWRGYGVVQAKFKQKPEDPARDGAWALQQLESDLKKFIDPERTLRKPQYYIFATNVVLTPVADSGSKDKAIALFEKYAPDLGLQGYVIWDYDAIRGFLDDNQELRRAYAAWITPGDVLAEVMQWFKPRRPDFERVIRRFLQEELRRDQFARLGQAGTASEDQIPLARVFIDLPVSPERKSDPPDEELQDGRLPPGFVSMALAAAAQRLDAETLHAWRQARPAAEDGAHLPGRFVLIGGPGQGKSTVGQFICQLFRTALLRVAPPHLIAEEARDALRQIEQQCQREGIELPTARRFPLRVVLNDFAARLDPGHPAHVGSLLEFIVAQIRKYAHSDLTIEDFRDWLGAYPWLLVLDALDEVPASSNRAEVLEAIKSFWTDAADCNADLLVIATTRPQGYNDDFSPRQYHHHWLLPLSKARALYYAGRLAELRHSRDQERQEKIVSRLERAAASEATRRLMGSPLQVTIMAVLVDQMGQPPQDRWSLFKSYYEVIYRRELERDIPASRVLRDSKTDIEVIHRRVGLLLQLETERAGGTDARLSAQRFGQIVDVRLREEGYSGAELTSLSQQIIEAATERLVFLVGLEADQVGFEIRALQEFMAAEALMDGGDSEIEQRLHEIAPIVSWRNVFLFAAGRCFAERQYLRGTILAICTQLNDSTDDQVTRLTLAGSQLALDLLEDGPARSKPNFAHSFARLALRLLDAPFGWWSLRLADVYADSLELIYSEELETRIAQPGTTQSAQSWLCLVALVEKGNGWARELADHYWSGAGKDRISALASLINTSRGGGWSLQRLMEIAPQGAVYSLSLPERIRSIARTTQIELPTWFEAVLQTGEILYSSNLADLSVALSLLDVSGDTPQLSLGLFALDNQALTKLIPLRTMPDPGAGWIPWVAACNFVAAPSRSTLAQVLCTIAPYQDTWARAYLIRAVPWVLGACLAACTTEDQLFALAKRVEEGELGELLDWRAAEERWRTQPLTIVDFEHMTDAHWPFDARIGGLGFPFASVADVRANKGITLVEVLLGLYVQLPDGRMRTMLMGWINAALPETDSATETYDQRELRLRLQPLQVLFQALQPSRSHFSVLQTLASVGMLDETWIDVLDGFGQQNFSMFWNARQLMRWFAEQFGAQPARLGLLRLLALAMDPREKPDVSSALVDPSRYDEPLFREAAITVRLALGFESRGEAIRLAHYAAEIAATNVEWLDYVLFFTPGHRAAEPFNEVFLLELLRLIPSTQYELKDRIIAELNDALRQRTSQLHDPDVWQRLGLPPGLNTI